MIHGGYPTSTLLVPTGYHKGGKKKPQVFQDMECLSKYGMHATVGIQFFIMPASFLHYTNVSEKHATRRKMSSYLQCLHFSALQFLCLPFGCWHLCAAVPLSTTKYSKAKRLEVFFPWLWKLSCQLNIVWNLTLFGAFWINLTCINGQSHHGGALLTFRL